MTTSEIDWSNPVCEDYSYHGGGKYWVVDGYFHRLDGPAVEGVFSEGPSWWYQGIRISVNSQKEFEQWLKMKAFW
jgi:hypothetical protein